MMTFNSSSMPNSYRRKNQLSLGNQGARRLVLLALVVGCCSLGVTVQAADGGTPPSKGQLQAAGGNGKGKGKSKPIISERPQVLGTTTTEGSPRPVTDTSTTAQLVGQFQTARGEFLAAQKELNLMKNQEVTDEQRALLRDKAKDALAKWQEEHRMYVEEQKERTKQMRLELQPEISRVLDGAGESGGSGRGR
jgi:hypothetical protein